MNDRDIYINCLVNIMIADRLTTQVAGASAAMLLTQLFKNVLSFSIWKIKVFVDFRISGILQMNVAP